MCTEDVGNLLGSSRRCHLLQGLSAGVAAGWTVAAAVPERSFCARRVQQQQRQAEGEGSAAAEQGPGHHQIARADHPPVKRNAVHSQGWICQGVSVNELTGYAGIGCQKVL